MCIRDSYLLERRPEEVVFVGAGGGRIDHWMANFQLLIYLEKNGIRARAEQKKQLENGENR